MAKVKIEIDDKTYKRAKKVVEGFGLDLPSVTRAFYKQIVREQGIPLNLSAAPAPATDSAPKAAPVSTAESVPSAVPAAPEVPAEFRSSSTAAPAASATGAPVAAAGATVTAAPSQSELMERMRAAMEAEGQTERDILASESEELAEDSGESVTVGAVAEVARRSVTVGGASRSKKKDDEASWRDNWLFEDDDSEDDLLFSPFEFQ